MEGERLPERFVTAKTSVNNNTHIYMCVLIFFIPWLYLPLACIIGQQQIIIIPDRSDAGCLTKREIKVVDNVDGSIFLHAHPRTNEYQHTASDAEPVRLRMLKRAAPPA